MDGFRENGSCGFIPCKKYICAGNIDLGILGINVIIDAMEVD